MFAFLSFFLVDFNQIFLYQICAIPKIIGTVVEESGYIALGRGIGLRNYVDVVNNNVANSNTDGFGRELMLFRNYVANRSQGSTTFTYDAATYIDDSPGDYRVTNGSFDLAIMDRSAYFGLETPWGVRYTRSGNFRVSPERVLINSGGYPVLSADGDNIEIPDSEDHIQFTRDGEILIAGKKVATVGVFKFASSGALNKAGATLLAPKAGVEPELVEKPEVKHGVLEGSNVPSVEEMTNLIKISRESSAVSSFSSDLDKIQHDLMKVLLQNQ